MTLEQKIELVEKARAESLEFDEYFKELLGRGLSHVGAYNESAKKLEPKASPVLEQKKPVSSAKKTSSPAKTEKVNEQPSKP